MAFPEVFEEWVADDGVTSFNWMEGVEVLQDDIVDQSRWMTYHTAIVKHEGRFWGIDYGTGSTEYQENDNEYEVYEVEPVEVTVTQYRRK